MSRDTHDDDLPEAVVAAIVALLAQRAERDEGDEHESSGWAGSGRVAPAWRGEREWGRSNRP